jgi:arabinose-5-phosphate isomerase
MTSAAAAAAAPHAAPGAPPAGGAEPVAPGWDAAAVVAVGRRVVELEAAALAETARRLGPDFARAVALVAGSTGRVIVSGVGKSGVIARKIAATLTSTGTPAAFLHPIEGLHGDLGIVGPDDVAVLLSKSGETAELLPLVDELERFGVRIIAVTAELRSTLARNADVALDAWVREEACPHDLAPTTSTTAALALGDALAVALLEVRGFRREDFARLHPGGALGRRLTTRVADVMVTQDLPALPPGAPMRDAVVALAERRGIVVVVDGGRVAGVFTSGDFTRLVEHRDDWLAVRVGDVMRRDPKTARADELGSAVAYRMQRHGIMAVPVVDDAGALAGVVHLHDLLRAGAA